MTMMRDGSPADDGGGNSGPGWPLKPALTSPIGDWHCPRWCHEEHEAGRHHAIVDTIPLTGDETTAEMLIVALVERLGGSPRVEILRDTGTGVPDVLGLSEAEAVRLHYAVLDAFELLGVHPERIGVGS
jgi:hypothetical protein